MLAGELKQILANVLTEVVENHQKSRAAITQQIIDQFMGIRSLNLKQSNMQ